MNNRFEAVRANGDLHPIGKSNEVAAQIIDQKSFDDLFHLVLQPERNWIKKEAGWYGPTIGDHCHPPYQWPSFARAVVQGSFTKNHSHEKNAVVD